MSGCIGAAFCWAFGGFDAGLAALLVCMAVDYISGSIVALVFHKSTKTETGAYNSMYGLKGLLCIKASVFFWQRMRDSFAFSLWAKIKVATSVCTGCSNRPPDDCI